MSKRSSWIVVLGMVLIGLFAWRLTWGSETAQTADSAPDPAVPVTAAPVEVKDVPLLLSGLGTVQALNTVEVKAQVTGTLIGLPAREGQAVKQGDVVAVIDPRPYQAALDQATAQREEDIALLKGARLDLQRYQQLLKTSFAPQQQVDDQQATVDKQAAALALDTAQIETAEINLGYCTIRAPMDGRVSLYQLNIGNLVQSASQTGIISITQTKPIAVMFTLPEIDLPQIQAAQLRGPVTVQVARGEDPNNVVASGTLLTPNNTIDTTTGTISLKAMFPNQDEHLWPGQFVDVRVQLSLIPHAVTVPVPAVQHGPDGLFVYMVKPDQTVAQTPVTVGYQDDKTAVVTNGLSGGETVVLSGQSRLGPGVKIQASTAART
jgi:multidrug efflux system membrane fusion protein